MGFMDIRFHNEAIASVLPGVCILSLLVFALIAFRILRMEKILGVQKPLHTHVRFTVCGPLAVVCILAACAGPYRIKGDILKEKLGAKVAIGLDQSPSMGASDITQGDATALRALGLTPTRLSLCVANLSRAFKGMEGIEVVLFTFTGATDLRTGDWLAINTTTHRSFESLLHQIEPALWSGAGTDISRVFEEARHILGNEPSFFILCSDGGKAGSATDPKITRTKVETFSHGEKGEYAIPIYTLGAGTEGAPAPIPLFAPDGSVSGFLRSTPTGDNAFTEYDPVALREIADVSGGGYTHAHGLNSGRELLRGAILSGLRKNRNVKVLNPEDVSVPLILASLLFFGITAGNFSFLRACLRSPFRL